MEKSLNQTALSTFAAAAQTFCNISYAQHPEDQILNIVRKKGSVLLSDLPKHLRRTSKWTLSLEKQGFIKRIKQKGQGDCKRLLLVYCEEVGKNGTKGT
ncbi:MAG: hypothetical protein Q8O41_09410 [Candidatus Methanoperedens sp.]|nr:hypothetical protein [Candidatus Methanoperedens sp.]